MERAYKRKLKTRVGQDVIVDRADAPSVEGKLEEADDDGCTIAVPKPEIERDKPVVMRVFIDYSHIRGIGTVGWDLSER